MCEVVLCCVLYRDEDLIEERAGRMRSSLRDQFKQKIVPTIGEQLAQVEPTTHYDGGRYVSRLWHTPNKHVLDSIL
jgi:hypothetical protein